MKNVYIKRTAIAPIFHSQPPILGEKKKENNVSTQRTELLLCRISDTIEAKRQPCISGNAERGATRREFIMHILDALGFVENKRIVNLPYDMAELMLTGGVMNAGEKSVRKPLVQNYIDVYDKLPFFGLFGGVYKTVFFTGRLSVGFVFPVIQSTANIISDMDSPFVSDFDKMILPENIYSKQQNYVRMPIKEVDFDKDSFEHIIAETKDYPDFITALNSDIDQESLSEQKELNAVKEYFSTSESKDCIERLRVYFKVDKASPKKVKEDVQKKIKSLFITQGIFGVNNAIPAGTYLHSRISFLNGFGDDSLIEPVFDAFVETLTSRNYIGGMMNRGYGAIISEARTGTAANPIDFSEVSTANSFWEWLENNKSTIQNDILNFDKILFGETV